MEALELRSQSYYPIEWEDRVVDSQSGDVLVEGTPVNEINLNRIESGMLTAHYDIGLAATTALQLAGVLAKELEKNKKQRLVQGQATIVNNAATNGYFRDTDPFVTVAINGFAQINAPQYDVQLSITSADDEGRIGELMVYDKTQNGFKVRMTGSAKTVSFLWTLINSNV